MHDINDHTQHPRRIRSFVKRAGRMTPGQQHALENLWPVYGLELSHGQLDLAAVFGNHNPVIMEIGFGMGDSLITMAKTMPENNYLGIEVHQPGVGRLLNNAHSAHLTNLKVFCDDAIEVMAQCIPDHSLAGVQLFFPDPWHKKKHNKRRIVQSKFAQNIRQKLVPGGFFHMATDWQPYAEHMLEIMEAAPGYRNQAGTGHYSPQPDFRPVTKFQKRGEGKGHGVWDLIYQTIADE
ncbi:MAG: tRNA (guanosine(46)-N7)-methyltransferase TrmB [Gammaproteobacteria bacterium]|jgi:tRNA (guanine-N7-)-methyltransferase|nr:tRNA (guanosine(46)-N7)-methyltransferase TrmB [Gammaproteobacteria bacterium]